MLHRTDMLVCEVGEARVALPLDCVERVLHAVAFRALPGAPVQQPGEINLHGETRALHDLRALLGQPHREPEPEDVIVLAHTPRRAVALLVDQVQGVEPAPDGGTFVVDELESFLDRAPGTPAPEAAP